jgi:hypothetical protein
MFEGVGLQKITSIRLQLSHNKDTITYTKNKKCYKDTRYKCTIITSALNVSKRYSNHLNHSHKAKHAPIRIGLLFNGNH